MPALTSSASDYAQTGNSVQVSFELIGLVRRNQLIFRALVYHDEARYHSGLDSPFELINRDMGRTWSVPLCLVWSKCDVLKSLIDFLEASMR